MEEATFEFRKGWLNRERRHFLLRVARGTPGSSLWLMPSIDHGWQQNCEGFDSHVGFLSIDFVSLINP